MCVSCAVLSVFTGEHITRHSADMASHSGSKRKTEARPLMEIVVEMATEDSIAKRQKSIAPTLAPLQLQPENDQVPESETWKSAFLEVLNMFRTKRSLVGVMFVLGTLDMLLNLVNLVQLSSDDLNYVLVIGPPTRDQWICLCFFTIVGTLLYFPETMNTFSAMYR